jgi:hypothetical protein
MSSQPPAPAPGSAQPRGLVGVFVIAIVVACLSIFNSFGGIVGLLVGRQVQIPAFPGHDAAPDAVRKMLGLQQRIFEASLPVPMGVIGLCALPVAVLVIVSVLRLRKRKPDSPRWLFRAAAALTLAEVATMTMGAIVQFRLHPLMVEMADIFQDLTRETSTSGRGLPPIIGETMGTVMRGSMIVGLVFGIGWVLGRIAGLLYVCHYASKPEVRQWVEAERAAT